MLVEKGINKNDIKVIAFISSIEKGEIRYFDSHSMIASGSSQCIPSMKDRHESHTLCKLFNFDFLHKLTVLSQKQASSTESHNEVFLTRKYHDVLVNGVATYSEKPEYINFSTAICSYLYYEIMQNKLNDFTVEDFNFSFDNIKLQSLDGYDADEEEEKAEAYLFAMDMS